jgi:ubiquinone/menaquinone biosynthesis C-methylase UbiE/mannose-6-phosphate isomerase-like protein (cupin superfamily)
VTTISQTSYGTKRPGSFFGFRALVGWVPNLWNIGSAQYDNASVKWYQRRTISSSDINDLSGRARQADVTAFVAGRIASIVPPNKGETVVDISCGDGSALLQMAELQPVAHYIGVLPTAEEVARVAAHIEAKANKAIKIFLGRAENTGLPADTADKIICSSVLPLVPDLDAVLAEMARIARQGATVFLGEMPHCDEMEREEQRSREYRRATPLAERIIRRVREFGLNAVIPDKVRHFTRRLPQLPYATPKQLAERASLHGLRIISHQPSLSVDAIGRQVQWESRYDYRLSVEKKREDNVIDGNIVSHQPSLSADAVGRQAHWESRYDHRLSVEKQREDIVIDGKICATVIRAEYDEPGIRFFTDNKYSQQLASMSYRPGKVIPAHTHNPVRREVFYTQETLFVRKGKVRVDFYSEAREYRTSRVLGPGDVILLISGGHGFEVLEELNMIEVKQGPYAGEMDKTHFPPVSSGEVQIVA